MEVVNAHLCGIDTPIISDGQLHMMTSDTAPLLLEA
jgi:hypothetical protein